MEADNTSKNLILGRREADAAKQAPSAVAGMQAMGNQDESGADQPTQAPKAGGSAELDQGGADVALTMAMQWVQNLSAIPRLR